MLTTFAGINGHLNPFENSNNCNFTLIKRCYAGGVFCRNGCPMPVLLTSLVWNWFHERLVGIHKGPTI